MTSEPMSSKAARELGYRPNTMARSLVQQRSYVLGVMLSNLHNPFFADVVDGIEDRALENGYRALLNSGRRIPEREGVALETLLRLQTDGLILAGTLLDLKTIDAAGEEIPTVLITRDLKSKVVDSVSGDDRRGARLAVDHLVALGHTRIAHIDGGRGAGARRRKAGFVKAMKAHGLEPVTVAGNYAEEGGMLGVERLIEIGANPTAIFAANDLAAIGTLQALFEAGRIGPG